MKIPALPPSPRIECLDCFFVFDGQWALSTRCPHCGRGFTLPVPVTTDSDVPLDSYLNSKVDFL